MSQIIKTSHRKSRNLEQKRLKSFINFDVPYPKIIEPDKGFQIYVFIEEDYNESFTYNQESIYFWPTVLKNYHGLKPIKKIILSNISYIAKGIYPEYKGYPIVYNDTFIFEEKPIYLNDSNNHLKISEIDHFFDIEINLNEYRGDKNLFSMTLYVEDFLGNLSNKIMLNFISYDGYN